MSPAFEWIQTDDPEFMCCIADENTLLFAKLNGYWEARDSRAINETLAYGEEPATQSEAMQAVQSWYRDQLAHGYTP